MNKNELKKIRKNLGLTQSEMAEKLDISLRSYHEKERGQAPVSKITEYAVKWMTHINKKTS